MRPRGAQAVDGDGAALCGACVIRQLEAVAAVIRSRAKRYDVSARDVIATTHRDLSSLTHGRTRPCRANGGGDATKTLGDGGASHVSQALDRSFDAGREHE